MPEEFDAESAAHYATQSLLVPLAPYAARNGSVVGRVYILSDDGYVMTDFNGVFRTLDTNEKPFPKPRPQFVEDCLQDPQCIGFVPASAAVSAELKRAGMGPIFNGGVLPDIGRGFDLYHKRLPITKPR